LIVTLHRPHRLNAFDATMREELRELWKLARADSRLRAVVVTGEGRGFCSGADAGDLAAGVKASADGGAEGALDFLPAEWLAVPVIVAVNGLCSGGGLHFIADADIVIGSDAAWFNDPHVSVGQVSALEPLTLLGRVSWQHVAAMVLQGGAVRIDAQTARAQGFLDEIVPADRLLPRALEIADVIAVQSPSALQRSLGLLRRARREPVRALLDEGWDSIVEHWAHPDADEGPRAFMEKRQPRWAAATESTSSTPAPRRT
jgi:enoyl-CoA hydratase/carnithine racemase